MNYMKFAKHRIIGRRSQVEHRPAKASTSILEVEALAGLSRGIKLFPPWMSIRVALVTVIIAPKLRLGVYAREALLPVYRTIAETSDTPPPPEAELRWTGVTRQSLGILDLNRAPPCHLTP